MRKALWGYVWLQEAQWLRPRTTFSTARLLIFRSKVRIAGRKIGLSPCLGRECERDKMRYV